MKGDISMQRLRVLLRVISIVFVVVFLLMFLLRMMGSGLVAEGTVLARLLLWRPLNMAYESMLVAIYVVWGGFLWRASENPLEHRSLIDFTIWANAAHAGVMFILALSIPGELVHLVGDVPLLALIVVVLYAFRPRAQSVSPAAASRSRTV